MHPAVHQEIREVGSGSIPRSGEAKSIFQCLEPFYNICEEKTKASAVI